MAREPGISYYRNLDNNDYSYGGANGNKVLSVTELASLHPDIDWSKSGYHFKNWNTKRDGSGQNYYPHDIIGSVETSTLYAIWEKDSMSYVDKNTPVIEKITLPSGNTYYIADREIRDVVEALSDTIAGGVSYIIAWDGTAAPVEGNIPAGVTVTYNGTTYTGTLDADDAQAGAFYLVKSATITTGAPTDSYDEYVPVGDKGSKSWEKIGDTQIDLSDVVTAVSLNKQTDTVIGTDSTFTVTQPTITLATGSSGDVTVATGITSVTNPTISLSAETATATGRQNYIQSVSTTKLKGTATGGAVTASGDNVTALTGLGTASSDSVLGADTTFNLTNPSVALASGTTGDVTVATGIGGATTKYLSASASGGKVTASGDDVTALTGLGTPTTQSAVKSVSPTTAKLATTTVTGVSGSTTPSVVQGRSSQTTAKGTGTASTTNTDWIKGVSVSNGVLTIGAATMDTQTTYSANAPGTITVPTAAATATTVATGATTSSGSGASVVTNVSVGDTFDAVTGYTPSTDTVIGTASTFNVTNPTVSLTANSSSATGRIQYVQAQGSATTTKLSAAVSGGSVVANADDEVTAVTGYNSPTTDTVIGTGSTFNVTNPTVTLSTGTTGDVTVATGGTTKYLQATASGAAVTPTTTKLKGTATKGNVAWNNKDSVTVLKSTTDVDVTKGK